MELLAGSEHSRILRLLAESAPLDDVLTQLVELVEARCETLHCLILRVSGDARIARVTAPRVPPSVRAQLRRRELASCAELLPGGLRVCAWHWIFSSSDRLLGAVVLASHTQQTPSAEQRQVVEDAAHLAAIAIERKRMKATLLERERRLHALLEGSPTGICFLDLTDPSTLHPNPALQKMLRCTRQELSRIDTFHELTAPEDRERDEALHAEIRNGVRSEYHQQKHYILRDGSHVWANVMFTTLPDASGRPRYIVAMHEDVTEQKLAESALRETEERSRAIVRAMPDLMFLIRADGVYLDCHAQPNHDLFVPQDEFAGRNITDLLPPAVAAQFFAAFRRAAQTDEMQVIEYALVIHGAVRHSETRIVRSGDDAFLVIVRDTTERRRAQEALVESEARYRNVVETQSEMIVRCLPDTTLTFVNDAYCRYLGRTREELIGSQFIDFMLDSERQGILDALTGDGDATGSDTNEHRFLRADGTMAWMQWTKRVIRDQSGQILEFQGIGRDITDRKVAEEALRASEERYRNVVESQTDLICRYLPDATLTFVNDAYCRYFGRTREQLLGVCFYDLLPEEQRAWAAEFIQSLIARPRIEVMEHPVVARDGEIRWQRWIDHVIFDAEGRVVELQGIGSDITDRKLAEDALRRSEEALRLSHEQVRDQAARLMSAQEEERRRIAADLHDDLNQKVAAVAILLSRIRQQMPPAAVMAASQLDLVHARVTEIADDIRRVSHQLHPTVLEHVGLDMALRSYVMELSRLEGVDVRLSLTGNVSAIPREAAFCLYRVTQEALRNVVKHAGSATADLELSVTGGTATLRIADRGVGFDVTRARGGAGLGLVSMEERVRLLHGRFELRAQPGRGTELLVVIPIAVQSPMALAEAR